MTAIDQTVPHDMGTKVVGGDVLMEAAGAAERTARPSDAIEPDDGLAIVGNHDANLVKCATVLAQLVRRWENCVGAVCAHERPIKTIHRLGGNGY